MTGISQETQNSIEQSNRTLQNEMQRYENTSEDIQALRYKLIGKMIPAIDQMDLSVSMNTDPELYAAQSRMLSETRHLLNDAETSSRNVVMTKLKQKDTEIQAASTINAADYLSQIRLTGGVPMGSHSPVSQQEIDALIETQFHETGCVLLETELEQGGSQLPERKVSENF